MSDNLIPAGIYKAVASPVEVDGIPVFAQFGKSKSKDGQPGTKQVAVQFEILEGQCAGRKVTWFGFFTEKSWERTIKGLRCCGYKGDDLFQLSTQTLDQEVSITVEHNTWEGKTSARVAWVNPANGGVKLADPMGTDELRKFAAMMKPRVAKVATVEGKKAEPGKAPASAPVDEPPPPPVDDDLPF